eukprot:5774340-Ditylum_brightwellii.AAC.2
MSLPFGHSFTPIQWLSVIWNKRLVPTVEEYNTLSPVQFRNRKGRTTLDTLLLKVVTMDSRTLFQLNVVILSNDTKACYDRMIPEVTLLHLSQLGFPEKATKTSILLNQNMKHYVKTTASVTREHYKHTVCVQSMEKARGKLHCH